VSHTGSSALFQVENGKRARVQTAERNFAKVGQIIGLREPAHGKGRGSRIHDMRHSFASRALALGESLSMIGKLLGHNKIDTTARYAHLARDSIKASSARVADSIGADILDGKRDETAAPA